MFGLDLLVLFDLGVGNRMATTKNQMAASSVQMSVEAFDVRKNVIG